MSRFEHPLALARGHGSARSGLHHWIAQRISAVLLLFLVPWLAYALICLSDAGHAEAVRFAENPWNAALLTLSLLALLYHAVLGLQVVIEDYVHQRTVELALHFVVRAGALLLAILGVIHILKLALGG